MLHLLKRHPIPVRAHFEFSLVLAYAFDQEFLTPLLPPGLELDTYDGLGFLAIAMVQTRRLRPRFLPVCVGQDFFLTGYRIFVKHKDAVAQRTLRGLRILRSDTNHAMMAFFGNRLTHYNYRRAKVKWTRDAEALEVDIRTPGGEADLHVRADLAARPSALPAGSPFADLKVARRFAGPLPFTFDYEAQTHSIIKIEGVRQNWNPRPVGVEVREATFFDRPPFDRIDRPRLANAFFIENVAYEWKRGIREPLPRE